MPLNDVRQVKNQNYVNNVFVD